MTNQKTFHVRTTNKVFNSVNSPEHFTEVRENTNHHSPVTEVFEWVNGQGWVKVNNHNFQ